MSDSEEEFAISRLDQPSVGTHGWQVRLQRKGVRYGRFFSDSAWGGREASFALAVRYRDRIISHVERPDSERSTRSHALPSSRNTSGVVGVTKIVQRSANGDEYRFWQASWTTAEGERKTVRYSVLKHGDEEAFRRACVSRREGNG